MDHRTTVRLSPPTAPDLLLATKPPIRPIRPLCVPSSPPNYYRLPCFNSDIRNSSLHEKNPPVSPLYLHPHILSGAILKFSEMTSKRENAARWRDKRHPRPGKTPGPPRSRFQGPVCGSLRGQGRGQTVPVTLRGAFATNLIAVG